MQYFAFFSYLSELKFLKEIRYSLSVEQRKMLIDFIELLKDYDVDNNNTKRG